MQKTETFGFIALAFLLVIVGAVVVWTLSGDDPGQISFDEGESVIPQPPLTAAEEEILAEIDGDRGEEYSPDVPEPAVNDTLGRIEGTVVDEMRRPIKGARLSILRNRGASRFALRYKLKPLYREKSDKKGAFSLGPLYAGTGYVIIVEHESHAERMIENIYVSEGETTRLQPIVLERGLTAFGSVRDEKGNALAGARVAVYGGSLRSSFGSGGLKPDRQVLTDEKGHYRLENIQHNGFFLSAAAKGFADRVERNRNAFSGMREFKIDFLLQSELRITGRVINEWDEPVEGAVIEAYRFRQADQIPRTAISRKDGTYTIHGLERGDFRVAFSHTRYVTATRDRLTAGTEGFEVKLIRRTGLSGQVVKPNGAPLERFWINVKQVPRPGDLVEIGMHRKYTHDRGRFVVDGLSPGTYILEVAAKGFAHTHSGEIVVTGDAYSDAGTIAILAGGTIAGTLFAPDGHPAAGARVSLRHNNYRPSRFEEAFGVTTTIRTRPVRTDRDGTFVLETVSPGNYQIAFRYGSCPVLRINNVAVANEAITDLGAVNLEPGGTIEGQVFAASGALAAGARISIVRDDGSFYINVTADKEGRFKATPLPAGTYTLSPEPARMESENFFASPPPSPQSKLSGVELQNGGSQYVTLQIVLERNIDR